jgi:hypothetical protein
VEEHILKIFENIAIAGPKGDEMIGGWRKLHNEELSELVLFSKQN